MFRFDEAGKDMTGGLLAVSRSFTGGVMANEIVPDRKFLELARLFYDRGLVILSLLTLFVAFFCATSKESMYGEQTTNALEPLHWSWEGGVQGSNASEYAQRVDWLNERAEDVAHLLQERSIASAVVYHRVKSLESAKEKALRRGTSVADLNDLYGMRVVVQNELDVYRCLDAICSSYDVVWGTLKNYIANPKASGYQSIHVVASLEGRRVEFQLRTQSMHEASELEHEAYKARVRVA